MNPCASPLKLRPKPLQIDTALSSGTFQIEADSNAALVEDVVSVPIPWGLVAAISIDGLSH